MLPNPRSETDDWNTFLLNSLDRGLDFFGESTKRVVYWNFEEKYHLKRDNIPGHIPEFAASLKTMFGVGSPSLVKRIAIEMNTSQQFEFRETDDLISLVSKARKTFQNGTLRE